MNELTRLSNWIIGRTSLGKTILSAAILVAVLVAMEASPIGKRALEVASDGRGMLDMRFSYSADYALLILGARSTMRLKEKTA